MSIQQRLWLNFSLIFTFIFVIVVIEHYTSDQIHLSEKRVIRTHEVLTVLEAVTSNLKDAETGQRGYLLTSEEDYLEPYYSALTNLPVKFQRLELLIKNNPEKLKQLIPLRALVNKKLAELDDTILLHSVGRVDSALELVLTDEGKQIMDDIRTMITEMKTAENELLNQQMAESSEMIDSAVWIIDGGSILILLFAGLVSYLTSKSISQDYTKLQLTKKALATANDELQSFVYRTSHDFKSPLLGIKSMSIFIEEDLKEGNIDEALHNVSRIRKNANTLENVVTSTLQLAKTDLSDNKVEPVDLYALITDVNTRLEGFAEDRGVELKLGSGMSKTGLNRINTDLNHLMTVLENLVSNGIKYSDDQCEKSFVTIDVTNNATQNAVGSVNITINDNGVGIPKERHKEVFGMFKQFHPDRANGTGLGMYIVKKSIERISGSISFESSNKGTQFIITVPNLSLSTVQTV